MKTRKAVYAASLDPITYGHINVIERMAPLYDELIVLVAVDPRKTYRFTPEERVEMAKAATIHFPNVTVDTCIGRYVVKQAEEIGALTVIRGLRNSSDLIAEQELAEENRQISPKIETLFVPCLPSLMHVSSSLVRGHIGLDPDWENQVLRSTPASVVAKLKEKYILGKARKHWDSLMTRLGNPKGSELVFKDLVAHYSEPHREHHNLEHIVSMLDDLELINEQDVAVVLAVWIHDDSYDPKAKDNEEKSAQSAWNIVSVTLALSSFLGEEVHDLILFTKHTKTPTEHKAQVLVDLDLAILGKPEKEFDKYEVGIRKEYEWVPEPEFRSARAKILQSFLDRPSIYSTEFFKAKYENTARKNLERSIKQLKKFDWLPGF